MPTIEQLETRWLHYMESAEAVPLLGLAAVTDEDANVLKRAIHNFVGGRVDALPRSLEVYPAATATWMAVTAANAYHDGTFWSRFAVELGFPGGFDLQAQRQALSARFAIACSKLKRPRWVRQRKTGFPLVEQFLFHAGFPVCHSRHLAAAMRSLENSGELPDPTEIDAGEILRDRLVDQLGRLPIPTMLRALRGNAGPLVADAALEVLFTGSYDRLNPRLGEALKEAFNARRVSLSGPRLSPPTLRLDNNISGLQIVCPALGRELVHSGHFGWVVNGRKHAWSATEEFVVDVSHADTISIEASGLKNGPPLIRSWELEPLYRPDGAIHIFSATERCFKKTIPISDESVEMPAGDYWLLVPPGWTISNANMEYPWIGALAIHATVCPGTKAILEGPEGQHFQITSRLSPMLLVESMASRLTYDGDKLLFGQELVLEAWVPAALSGWSLSLTSGSLTKEFACGSAVKIDEDWEVLHVDVSSFFKQLPPALYEVQATLMRNGKPRAHRLFVFWLGCQTLNDDGSAVWITKPSNIEARDCTGFDIDDTGLKPGRPIGAFRHITFNVGGTLRRYRWRNKGLFAELVQLQRGRPATTQNLEPGSLVPISSESNAWLRVWFEAGSDCHLVINNEKQDRETAGKDFITISISDVAIRFAQGAKVEASSGGKRVLLARLVSPLQPIKLERSSSNGFRSLDFTLTQVVSAVRPVCVELISGEQFAFEPVPFGQSGKATFADPHGKIPSMTARTGGPETKAPQYGTSLGSLLDSAFRSRSEAAPIATGATRIGLDVPTSGWPEGFWLIGLEAARRPGDLCERLAGADSKPALLLIVTPPKADRTNIHQVLWNAWQSTLHHKPESSLQWHWTPSALLEATNLIGALHFIFPNGPAEPFKNDFAWVKVVEDAVSIEAERLLRARDSSAPQVLLRLGQSLIRIPEVFTFPAQAYGALRDRQPVFAALRRCADFCAFDWFSEYILEHTDVFAELYLRGFANYDSVVKCGAETELENFDLAGYWRLLTSNSAAGPFSAEIENNLLGRDHWNWALTEFRRRYAATEESDELGAANACAHRADSMLQCIRHHVGRLHIIPAAAWLHPCPSLNAHSDLEESLIRLCSTFALAARATSYQRLPFGEAMAALRGNQPSKFTEAGLNSLLSFAPELFGFFLLFWQITIKTGPHDD